MITEIKHISELSLVSNCAPVVLLVSSIECGWCGVFEPVYKKIEETMGKYYSMFLVKAESVGGRAVLRENFIRQFGKRYNGFPSVFIIDGRLKEIPMSVLWDKTQQRFNEEAIVAFMNTHLSIRRET
jgi:hypothetical protein